jgi:hypothetical protein
MPKFNKQQYSLREMYMFYKKTCTSPVTITEYKHILEVWGDKVNEYVIQGKDVKLYHGLSVIGVRKRIKPFYVDGKASREAKKVIRKPNTHSGGFGAHVMWRRHYTTMSTRGWEFEPSRVLSRGVSTIMKMPGGHTTYVQKARAASTEVQRRALYNRNVHKI